MPQVEDPVVAFNHVELEDRIFGQGNTSSFSCKSSSLQTRCIECLALSWQSLTVAQIVNLADHLRLLNNSHFAVKLYTQALLRAQAGCKKWLG